MLIQALTPQVGSCSEEEDAEYAPTTTHPSRGQADAVGGTSELAFLGEWLEDKDADARGSPGDLFNRIDADGDGVIDRTEWALYQSTAALEQAHEDLLAICQMHDASGFGFLPTEMFQQLLTRVVPLMPKELNEVLQRSGSIVPGSNTSPEYVDFVTFAEYYFV